MKRTLITLALMISAVTAFAKPPHLATEQLFDGRYNKNKSVSTSIYRNNGTYYRGMTVTGNPGIVRKIADAISKDADGATNYSDYSGSDGQYTSLKIVNNGETIHIGLKQDSPGSAFFFIQGKEKAFK